MKVRVNRNLCIGGQDCVNTCPEVFKMNKEKAFVYANPVSKRAEVKCRLAQAGCPTGAITIEE